MRALRLGAASVAAAAIVALPVAAAWAHAVLVGTSPVDGETWLVPPSEVLLEFDEAVTAPVAAIRVFDAEGDRVDLGQVDVGEGGTIVVAPLEDDLAAGTYIVTWRVVSADGHPLKGAFIFHIEHEGEPVDESFVESLLGSSADRPFTFAAAVARWVSYLAALLVIGALAFTTVIAPDQADRGAIARMVRLACLAGAIASVLLVPLFAAESTGLGLSALRSGGAWEDAVTGTVGVSALVGLLGFALMYLSASTGRAAIGWTAALSLILSALLAGHTRTTEPAWLVWVADAVHVAAASVWFGGVAALLLTWRRERRADDPGSAATAVGKFSAVAAWSVLALLVAGAALAWAEVRSLHAATSTPYGWTLIVKVGIVAGVLGIAVYNNRVLVPAILSGRDERAASWSRLGTTMRWELVGIVAAVAVTAFLVNLQPAAEAAGVVAPYSTFVDFGEGEVNVVVDPNRVGDNEIHLYFLTEGGSPVDAEGEITLELALPAEDIGPVVRMPEYAGSGHYFHAGGELALPGTWEITIRQRLSEFREEVVVVSVVVNE